MKNISLFLININIYNHVLIFVNSLDAKKSEFGIK